MTLAVGRHREASKQTNKQTGVRTNERTYNIYTRIAG